MNQLTHIDIDIVENIIKENNGLEIQWLRNLLESGIKVMGTKGRSLQAKRFLDQISSDSEGRQDSGQ